MNQIAHALNKKTFTEFVQNEKTLSLFKKDGVDFVQGYSLGKSSETIDTLSLLSLTQRITAFII